MHTFDSVALIVPCLLVYVLVPSLLCFFIATPVACTHNFGVSFLCYGVRHFSPMRFEFNGYLLVSTFYPPSPPYAHPLNWALILASPPWPTAVPASLWLSPLHILTDKVGLPSCPTRFRGGHTWCRFGGLLAWPRRLPSRLVFPPSSSPPTYDPPLYSSFLHGWGGGGGLCTASGGISSNFLWRCRLSLSSPPPLVI